MDAAPSETNARIKSTARIAIGIAITVVTLYVVYRDADPQQMLDAIGEFNLVMLLPFGLFYAVQLWAKTERWAQLLDRGTVKLRILFSTMMVGYTVNTLLPARLGEVARIYLPAQTGRNTRGTHTLNHNSRASARRCRRRDYSRNRASFG